MNLEKFKSCISALKEVRVHAHDQLDASIRAEFDSVIGRLETALTEETDINRLKVDLLEALEFLGRLLEISTNLSGLIATFWK